MVASAVSAGPSPPSTSRLRAAFVCVALLAAVAPPSLDAQELRDGPGGEPPLEVPRIEEPVTLDGRPDEPAWEEAASLEGVMHLPDFGAAPSEETEFLLAHDGRRLYFACRARDRDPDRIRVATLRRDESSYGTDSCGIRLDSFNDEENSVIFVTTPASTRTDWSFSNDASGPPNQDWDTFWNAAGVETAYGWGSEIRIPFTSVGFQEDDGRVVMGFAVGRTIARKNETIIHPAIPPRWGPGSIAKPSQMRKMVLRDVESRDALYLTPYGLTGRGRSHELNAEGDGYLRSTEDVFESGLDVKYGVTRNLTLDLTVNTDFAQVEADDQQVNLTRFSLFFPEKRRFFQERAAIFEFPLGFRERLFHSRRIGLVDGEQVRIFGGARLVGRVGDWDLGVLNMQTGEHGAIPSENMGVVRLRRRAFNQYSYLGGIVTSRLGDDGSYNVLYGNDAVVRLFGQDYLTVNWAQSFDAAEGTEVGTSDDPGFFDRSLARVNWQRRGTDGPVYSMDLVRAGESFEPGMGFLLRRDYVSGNGRLGYGWRPGGGSALNDYSVTATGGFVRRNRDATVESADYGLETALETRGGHGFQLGVTRSYEDLVRPFELSDDAGVPPGSYWFTAARFDYSPAQGWLFQPSFGLEGGRFYDGTRISAEVSPSWNASRHLRLSGSYGIDRIEFDDRDQRFTAHLARLRAEVMVSTELSALAFVQYNSTGDLVATNLRIRYNPREGNDLYVVWNESLNADRFAYDPVRPRSAERTILVKYAHTFTFAF